MQLIGVLDSPYVRRVAISLQLLGVDFLHKPLSVFSGFDEFAALNPLVKAPTLILDDGTMLVDSSLILACAAELASGPRRLWPAERPARQRELSIEGLALASCEKSVQIIYETKLRPAAAMHAPWLARITGQLLAAYGAIEVALAQHTLAVTEEAIGEAGISVAVAWEFTRQTLPGVLVERQFPRLATYAQQAEMLPTFIATPHSFTARVDAKSTAG